MPFENKAEMSVMYSDLSCAKLVSSGRNGTIAKAIVLGTTLDVLQRRRGHLRKTMYILRYDTIFWIGQ